MTLPGEVWTTLEAGPSGRQQAEAASTKRPPAPITAQGFANELLSGQLWTEVGACPALPAPPCPHARRCATNGERLELQPALDSDTSTSQTHGMGGGGAAVHLANTPCYELS